MTWLLLLIWLLPLALVSLVRLKAIKWLLPLAPIPALVAAAVLPIDSSLSLPWLLLGVELNLDQTGRVFLIFSGLLWLAASLFSLDMATKPGLTRFRVFFLLAMAGNLGLIVAGDMVSFYLGFTLMGLAAYGLVAHTNSQRAHQAARRYLVWTIAGELMLFAAIVLLVAQHTGAVNFDVLLTSPPGTLATVLLIVGFGIKMALPGLHFWLPQTYAVTPTPAVAVMSGVMIKAGLLGWLRFLPPGDASLVIWGYGLMVIGGLAILLGTVFGLLQQKTRLVLAYSSISKMGLLTLGMGAVLAWPGAAPIIISALLVYAAHHAMVKASLFLGLGLAEPQGMRPWLLVGLAFLALSLAGAPLTSGALAKSMLVTSLPENTSLILFALGASALGTTLLMTRFMYLLWIQYKPASASLPVLSSLVWLLLLITIALVPFFVTEAGMLSGDILYLMIGLLIAVLVLFINVRIPHWLNPRRQRLIAHRIILFSGHGILHLFNGTSQKLQRLITGLAHYFENIRLSFLRSCSGSTQTDGQSSQWPLTGMLWLCIGGLLLITLIFTT